MRKKFLQTYMLLATLILSTMPALGMKTFSIDLAEHEGYLKYGKQMKIEFGDLIWDERTRIEPRLNELKTVALYEIDDKLLSEKYMREGKHIQLMFKEKWKGSYWDELDKGQKSESCLFCIIGCPVSFCWLPCYLWCPTNKNKLEISKGHISASVMQQDVVKLRFDPENRLRLESN